MVISLVLAPLILIMEKAHAVEGLTAEVYNVQGQNAAPYIPPGVSPVITTNVPNIDFQWGSGSVLGGPSEDVIVRFTGYILSNTTQNISFLATADDGTRLYIDGVLVADDWVDKGGGGTVSAPISFTAGVPKNIELMYYENGGGANVFLNWDQSGSMQIIPASAFTSQAAPVANTIGAPRNLTVTDGATSTVLTWEAPNTGNTQPERYAIGLNTEGQNGWGIATGNVGDPNSLNTTITIDHSLLESLMPSGTIWSFHIRSDNDTLALYSENSNVVTLKIGKTAEEIAAEVAAAQAIIDAENARLAAIAAEEARLIEVARLAELARLAEEARLQAEAAALLAAQQEAARIAAEEEAARQAAIIAEQNRLAAIAEAARIEAERQAAIAEAARVESERQAAIAEANRIAAEQEAARQAAIIAEQYRLAEIARLAAIKAEEDRIIAEQEAAEQAERDRLAEEAAAQAEADRIAAEEAARIAEEERLAAEEAARIAEEERIAAEEAARIAEEERLAAEEAARIAEEERIKAEADAKAAEEARIEAEAEAAAKAEEEERLEAERVAAEEAAAQAEADRIAAEKAAEEAEVEARLKLEAELEAKQKAEAAAKAEAERIAAEKAKNETTKEEVKEAVAAVITSNTITQAQANEVVNALMADGNVSKAEVANLVEVLTADGGKLNESEKSLVADALIAQADGEALSSEQIKDSGIEYKDLPAETPVDVRTDEQGNAVVITAEVAAQVELLQDPGALLAEAFSDPGAALAALGSIGADMSTEEREEATDMVIATVVAAGAAINAAGVAAAAGGSTGGGSSGGSSSSPASRGGRRW
jgi:predicted XRE-type DNA-binding protein